MGAGCWWSRGPAIAESLWFTPASAIMRLPFPVDSLLLKGAFLDTGCSWILNQMKRQQGHSQGMENSNQACCPQIHPCFLLILLSSPIPISSLI